MKASDHQRIDSAIDRARHYGYCAPDLPLYDELQYATLRTMSCSRLRLSQTTSCIHYWRRRCCISTLQYARTFTFTAATCTFSSSVRLQFHYTYAVQKRILGWPTHHWTWTFYWYWYITFFISCISLRSAMLLLNEYW